jgi:hypothetical protein
LHVPIVKILNQDALLSSSRFFFSTMHTRKRASPSHHMSDTSSGEVKVWVKRTNRKTTASVRGPLGIFPKFCGV